MHMTQSAACCCAGGAARLKATEGFLPQQSNVLRMLGYFSLVGLQRVHALVGDYHGALKVSWHDDL
jgi:translation initiation factor 3 subunit L